MVLAAFITIKYQGGEELSKQLETLQNSEHRHNIREVEADYLGSSVRGIDKSPSIRETQEKIKNGVRMGSRADFNFRSAAEGGNYITTVAHEMRHMYDYDQGLMSDAVYPSSASSPQEKRAVKNENIIRKVLKLPMRTKYAGEKIN